MTYIKAGDTGSVTLQGCKGFLKLWTESDGSPDLQEQKA